MPSNKETLYKQNKCKKLEVNEKLKLFRILDTNFQQLCKYVKPKTKINKTVKNDKKDELPNIQVETEGILITFFQFVHSLEEFHSLKESCYVEDAKKL